MNVIDLTRPMDCPPPARELHVAVVLDRSGSMDAIRDAAIEGFNSQIRAIQANSRELPTRVTLVTFNDRVTDVFVDQPVDSLAPISRENYMPAGSTALYDAMGHTIEVLSAHGRPDTRYLVIAITDGYENASTFVDGRLLGRRIEELKGEGRWTFTYIGANQDVLEVARALNIPRGNTLSFEASERGTSCAFAKLNESTAQFMNYVSKGLSAEDFFSDAKQGDEKEGPKTQPGSGD